MADKKISQLTAATTPLAGTEVLPIVQSSTTVKATIADIQAAPVAAGTASTIPYLNASKVPTSGLALRFDGTNMGIGTSTTFYSSRLSVGGHISVGAGNSLKLWNAADNNLATLTGTGAAELSIAAAGGVKLVDGNLILSTAGKGIDFSATSNAAGMTSELLADYEEGTFTPSLVPGTSGSITLDVADGKYTRIGRSVTVTGVCSVLSVSSPVGVLQLQGLPFTNSSDNSSRSTGAIYGTGLAATATTSIVSRIIPSETQIRIEKFAAGSTSAMAGDVQAGALFQFSLTYFV